MKKALSYLLVSFSILVSCTKEAKDVMNAVQVPWEICATKASVVEQATYRACLFSADGILLSEGTYCGYQNPKGWLYPCRTDDNGNPLDTDGNVVDSGSWLETIDKDSKWALRAMTGTYIIYSLVFLSPALKNQTDDDGACYLPVDRSVEPEWKASKAVIVHTAGNTVNGSYVYNLYDEGAADPSSNRIINEQRSRITVKIACGKADYADIVSVNFEGVISSAKYLPLTSEYKDLVFDGGSATPLETYYTINSYPSSDGETAGAGEKFVSPEDTPVHLVHKTGIGTDETFWWKQFSSEDEWRKGSESGYMLTAIKDFYILPLDYSKEEGGELYYKDMVPEIVVTEKSKIDGKNKKITLQLAANVEPMKCYTIYLFISNIDVQVTMTIDNWDFVGPQEVMFGKGVVIENNIICIDQWETLEESITNISDVKLPGSVGVTDAWGEGNTIEFK